MIKLIATDLDGTFLTKNGMPSAESIRALRFAIDKDIKFVVSSGRFYDAVNKTFSKYDTDNNMIFVTHNGAWVQRANDGEILGKSIFSKNQIMKIVDYVKKKYPGTALFLGERDLAVLEDPSDIVKADFDRVGILIKTTDDLKNYSGEICSIGIHIPDGIPNSMYVDIVDKFSREFEVALSGNTWLDFVEKGINKGHGIEIIQNRYGIKPEETMVFGDYYNDIGMFKRAYFSYAMDHAPEDVKKHANFTAESDLEGGVAREIFRMCV